MPDSVQSLIDHVAAISGITPLVGPRIWVNNTIPREVDYDPSQGVAILIGGRGGGPRYAPVLSGQHSLRVYGPSRAAIVQVCDRLTLYGNGFHTRYVRSVLDVLWVHDNEPDTLWLIAYSFWSLHIGLDALGVEQWVQ